MRFENPAIPIALGAVLIDAIGFGIILPVLPNLIVELSGATVTDAVSMGGYLLAAYAVAQFIAGPVLGSLGDRYGRRPVLLFSMIAFAADYGMMAAAPTLAWLFVGRVIAGVAGATFGPASAMIADVTPPERRGGAFGLIGAAFGVGFILGPAIGGLLAAWGPRAPFAVAAGLAAASALTMTFLMPETLAPEKRRPFRWREANVFGAFRPLLHAGGAAPLLVAAFLWQLAHMVYPATWAFWAEIAHGWDAQLIGWSLAASGLTMALLQIFGTGRAIKRFGEERTVVIGMGAATAVFVGYILAGPDWVVFALIPIGALQGLVFPSINALLSRLTDASHQGALQGGISSIASVAAIVAPLAMTQALETGARQGFNGGNFLLAAMLSGSALLVVLLRVVPKVRAETAPA